MIIPKVLVFAGTIEGREVVEYLSLHIAHISVCVATEYGKDVLKNTSGIKVYPKRLSLDEMKEFFEAERFDFVIDATHPYATIVSANVESASIASGIEYIRIIREEREADSVNTFKNVEDATIYLSKMEGNILATTGSKELHLYSVIEDFANRVYARILPSADMIANAREIGFPGKNIIGMQGPFSHNLNVAMLREYNCKYIVTKNTGKAGGFDEKLSAAIEVGAKVILVERPSKENGLAFNDVLKLIDSRLKRK